MTLKPSVQQNPYQRPAKPKYGIHGWLRLIQIHMCYYMVMLVIGIYNNIQYLNDAYLPSVIILDIVFQSFQIGLIIFSFILMVNKLMLFRVFYTILLSTFILTAVLMIFLGGDIMWSIYDIAICTVWIIYLYKSEQVKNTFHKLNQPKTDYEIKMEEKKKAREQTRLQEQAALEMEQTV